ncbi:MAG: response regulator [Candidatus Omnitrophota bacterium]
MTKGLILLVEDSETKKAIYKKALEDAQYTVIDAGNGEEGLKIAQTREIDIIVTDLAMPIMDGFTMIHILKHKEETRYIPIICVSATYKDIADKLKALLDSGAEEYFYMPDNLDELIAKVEVMMRIRKIYLEFIEKNRQLKIFNDVAIGRELKMIELKNKIKELEAELAKYKK